MAQVSHFTEPQPDQGRLTKTAEEGKEGRSSAGTQTKIKRSVGGSRARKSRHGAKADGDHEGNGATDKQEVTLGKRGDQALVTQLMRVRVQDSMQSGRTGQASHPHPQDQHETHDGNSAKAAAESLSKSCLQADPIKPHPNGEARTDSGPPLSPLAPGRGLS